MAVLLVSNANSGRPGAQRQALRSSQRLFDHLLVRLCQPFRSPCTTARRLVNGRARAGSTTASAAKLTPTLPSRGLLLQPALEIRPFPERLRLRQQRDRRPRAG
jgi:hypothetical protein